MKKLKMFFAGALLAIAGNAMAQTVTLTANEATDKNGGWTLQVQAPTDIAGWQMLVNLPEGLSIGSSDLTVGGANFTKYDVTLPEFYKDSKYAVVGTQTAAGGYFLFCIPLAESYGTDDIKSMPSTGTAGNNICTINLIADPNKDLAGPQACSVTNIAISDAAGISTSGTDVSANIGHPTADVTNDFMLDVRDNALVLQYILGKITDADIDKAVADANKDDAIDVRDLAKMLNIILGKE